MLEFYEFNSKNICIFLISTFIIYYILSKYFSSNKNEDENNGSFNLEYFIISVLCAFCLSVLIAYILSGKDETILTTDYWDPLENDITTVSDN